MRREHVGDLGPVWQAHVRVGLDPFGSKTFHLAPALVDLDDGLGRLLAARCRARPGQERIVGPAVIGARARAYGGLPFGRLVVLVLVSGNRHVTILSSELRLSSDRAGCMCRRPVIAD